MSVQRSCQDLWNAVSLQRPFRMSIALLASTPSRGLWSLRLALCGTGSGALAASGGDDAELRPGPGLCPEGADGAALAVCGARQDQELLQDQAGGLHPQWLPLTAQAGGAEDQADRRDTGKAAGTAGGTHHR